MINTKKETIKVQPNWEATMKMLLVVLENGSEDGKQMAREELIALARNVDKINEGQPASTVSSDGVVINTQTSFNKPESE